MKIKKLLQIIFYSFIIYHLSTFITHSVQAQTLSLGIYPPLLEVKMKPGKIVTQAYRLKNQGDDTWVQATLLPFEPKDQKGHVKLPLNLSANSYEYPQLTWFSFQNNNIKLPGRFFLPAGKSQQLVLKIKVPESAKQKDYYQALVLKSDSPIALGESTTVQAGIITSNVLLTVSNTANPPKNGRINIKMTNPVCHSFTKFTQLFNLKVALPNRLCNLKIVDSLDKMEFKIKAVNTGDFSWKTDGKFSFLKKDRIVKTQDLEPLNVLAHSSREQTVRFYKHGWLMGKYTAQVEAKIDENNKVSDSLTIFALPYRIVLLIILSLGFGFWLKRTLKK